MKRKVGTAFGGREEQNKRRSVHDQFATDKNGRRRFEGAWTGGFTAGFHNTVGSKEGFNPKPWRSTREEDVDRDKNHREIKNKKEQYEFKQSIEDYMDDEDLANRDLKMKPVNSSKNENQTDGFKILQNLGWHQGDLYLESLINGTSFTSTTINNNNSITNNNNNNNPFSSFNSSLQIKNDQHGLGYEPWKYHEEQSTKILNDVNNNKNKPGTTQSRSNTVEGFVLGLKTNLNTINKKTKELQTSLQSLSLSIPKDWESNLKSQIQSSLDAQSQLDTLHHQKSTRFNTFIKAQHSSSTSLLVKPTDMNDNEWRDELNQFETESQKLKQVPEGLKSMFVRSSMSIVNPEEEIEEANRRSEIEKKKRIGKGVDKDQAGKMGMYGVMTREEEVWIPDRLLCKRFGVPIPTVTAPTRFGGSKKK